MKWPIFKALTSVVICGSWESSSSLVLLALLVCSSVSVTAAQTPGGPGSAGSGQTSAFTIVPGANTPVYLKVIPNAVCKLREKPQEQEDVDHGDYSDAQADSDVSQAPRKHLKLFSDADGNARFFVQPAPLASDGNPDEIMIVLTCLSPGVQSRYIVKLRASDSPTADMPFPPSTDPALNQSNQTILPPLQDPETPTNLQLLQAGYPVRPDPIQSPVSYAMWLKAVSNPINVVSPQTTPNPNLYYTLFLDRTNGVAVTAPAGKDGVHPDQPFVYVNAEWQVPTVTGEIFRNSQVGEWVGLDGLNNTHIWQAGTGQAVLPAASFHLELGHVWSLSTYDAWWEEYPYPADILTSLAVHPGDLIYCAVWIGFDPNLPSTADPSVYGKFASFQIMNYTTGQMIHDQPPTNFTFTGRDAEWIIERPSVGPSPSLAEPTDLANYHSQCTDSSKPDFGGMTMTNTVAWTQTGPGESYNYELYNGYNFETWNMITGGPSPNLLSYTYPETTPAGYICSQWVAFH